MHAGRRRVELRQVFELLPGAQLVAQRVVGGGEQQRLQQFIFNRSFWHDETLLATAFVDRGFAQLVFEPLANNQAAPVGYLVLVKLVTVLLGTHEWTLRLVSLLSGLATALALGTALVAAAFGVHVLGGGAFEMRTVGALALRLGFWAVVCAVGWRQAR